MVAQGFTRNEYDQCVYFKGLKSSNFIYLLLYVDDMLITSRSKKEIDKVKAQLSSEFEMKDLGGAKKNMGMEILRDRKNRRLCLTRRQYLEKVVARFVMKNLKPVSSPLVPHFKL